MKTIVTITGIRPDFIRMSFVFKELDKVFNHILIHTGQHFNPNMSEVFFQQLNIRQPDYILDTGKSSSNHYEQLAYLTIEIPKLFDKHNRLDYIPKTLYYNMTKKEEYHITSIYMMNQLIIPINLNEDNNKANY